MRRLGRMEYGAAYRVQKETEAAVKAGASADTLLLVEHPHVLTLGRRATRAAILASDDELAARGVAVYETNRGGKMTYHGLGQSVGYPVVNLSPDREDVHRYVRDLEEALIRALADFGVEGFRIEGLTGVHTARGKVAAIGVHISRWVTTHGYALNVNTDLDYFNLIVACEGEPVTSMAELLGRDLPLREVEDRIVARFAEVFDMTPEEERRGPGAGGRGPAEPRPQTSTSPQTTPAPQTSTSPQVTPAAQTTPAARTPPAEPADPATHARPPAPGP